MPEKIEEKLNNLEVENFTKDQIKKIEPEPKKEKFYKERREHRKEMREILPLNLQLEFPQKRIEKEKWSFEGSLLKLKNSQEPDDRLFFETLKMKVKKKLEKEISLNNSEKIENLEKLIAFKREKIIFYLKTINLYEKGINDQDPDVRRVTAGTLGELAKVNIEKALPLYEKGINDQNPNVRRATAGTLGELAKVDIEKYLSLYEKVFNNATL